MIDSPISYDFQNEKDIHSMALQEPDVAYGIDVIYPKEKFDSLSEILGFSQAEWADILHVSPRTLQRYFRDGTAFEGLQAELLHHIQRLTDLGLTQFTTVPGFVQWLRSPKEILGRALGFNALKTITGVRLLREELGRIAEGIYI